METRKAGSTDDGREALAAALERARREDGLSQQALARALGSSQANVSKLLRGRHVPRPALAKAIRTYLATRHATPESLSSAWQGRLLAACERSKAFRDMVDAALLLMNENE
jgi:transcriptional regulator with XRE-family HTH domain